MAHYIIFLLSQAVACLVRLTETSLCLVSMLGAVFKLLDSVGRLMVDIKMTVHLPGTMILEQFSIDWGHLDQSLTVNMHGVLSC